MWRRNEWVLFSELVVRAQLRYPCLHTSLAFRSSFATLLLARERGERGGMERERERCDGIPLPRRATRNTPASWDRLTHVQLRFTRNPSLGSANPRPTVAHMEPSTSVFEGLLRVCVLAAKICTGRCAWAQAGVALGSLVLRIPASNPRTQKEEVQDQGPASILRAAKKLGWARERRADRQSSSSPRRISDEHGEFS